MIRVEKHSEGVYLIEQADGGPSYGGRLVRVADMPAQFLIALFQLRFESPGSRIEGVGVRIGTDAYELEERSLFGGVDHDDDEV
jgi:hypothetical protein